MTGALHGQVAWITGAGSGIGLAAARALASAGATVVLSGRRPDPLEAAAAQIRAMGGVAEVAALDVTDAEAVAASASQILRRHEIGRAHV